MTTLDFLDGILGTDSNSPEDARTAEGQAESLDAGLDGLTARQRFVVERSWGLADGVEYSFREIADFMGVSHVAVAKHYHAAMRSLTGLTVGG